MPARTEVTVLTETEAKARTALLAIDSYEVSVDLTATPVRSHATLASVRTALDSGGLTARLRAVLQDQEAELRTAIAVKAAVPAARTPR